MFPLIPSDGGEAITFYKGEDKHRNNPLGTEYTYKYDTNHPTVFNGNKFQRNKFRTRVVHVVPLEKW